MRQVVLVPAVAALSFAIWLASVATLRYLLLPAEPTLTASVTAAANPNVAVAWLLIAVLMTAMLRPGDARSLKRAAAIATPMALVGMAVALGYHLERSDVAYALAAAILMIALIYGVAATLYMTAVAHRPVV